MGLLVLITDQNLRKSNSRRENRKRINLRIGRIGKKDARGWEMSSGARTLPKGSKGGDVCPMGPQRI